MENYKEKLELARDWYNDQSTTKKEKVLLENLFPELKESEDERIRKEIIQFLQLPHPQFVGKRNYEKWIVWLEKQDQKKHEEELENAYKCADEVQYRRGYEDAKREFENQGEQKPVISDDGLREGIAHFGITQYQIDNWLKKYVDVEKQGEQNNKHLYDVIIALWDLLDKIDAFSDLQIDDTNPDNPFKKIEYIAQERHKFVKSDGYNLYIQGEQITDFKQSKQKPADNVEPKSDIEKGKWYVCNTYRYRDFVLGKAYYCPKNGMLKPNENEMARYVARNCFHLWTIQDAKDGDVLVVNNIVFIYAHRKQMYSIAVADCFIDSDGDFHFDGEFGYTEKGNSIHPATKKECDLLFSKMNEAGYEWDGEKKELKKIKQTYSQKQEWTGYDEKAYEIALLDIDKSPSITKNNSIDWLKSLKNRVQPQSKQEWSEEDENMLQKAISTIMYALSIPIGKENDPCFVGSSTIAWLKSLKERIKEE